MVTSPDVTLNDFMRKVLSSTAGATFHEETPTFTINVKKEMIELIYKLAPSWYVIVNVFHASEKELMLCCEWGHYYDRLKNPAVQMPKIEKNCPTLYGILVGKDPDNVVDMYDHADSYLFGYRIPNQILYMPLITPPIKNIREVTEPLKEDLEPIIIMGLYHHRDLIGSPSAFIKVI